jgi:hypothetical protein
MGLWYPKWYPKNSGCLAGTQGMGGELRVSGVTDGSSARASKPTAIVATGAVDIRLARYACGHHISRAAESQIR